MYDFEGKTLLLTGAAGGIGREVARLFAAHGANLVLADLDAVVLASLADELEIPPERVAVIAFDASSEQDAQAAVALCQDRFGGLDFLVPSAGIYVDQSFADMRFDQWRQTMSVNLDGIFLITRAAIPALRKGGAIVQLSSMAAHRGSAQHAHYAATKGAINSLVRSLAKEIGPDIRVNAVAPGLIATPMTVALLQGRGVTDLESTPLKRHGQPAEVASVIGFLCSSSASYVTGEIIHVNGGLFMA
ncbi:3-oxoacyl-(acyl-carrier-protein) reductase [Sphingobium chlorophenolicum L-1]|uniref:3-oxoacyl-(Acyl-carrier-protein) reductase n=1 Tax=Sphingobium chlorophenolicum L-1 TaxID=690566 RepID=F6F1Y8_SPHCR|nr:SDR family NAD(P)-dependent oxidoreductase [Sphingobium chlorophenolicum]AEG51554.1 3-oxoacyl-(acyl-carrier-protein) reductase [Sphingobium chlorophenolicum L-1]